MRRIRILLCLMILGSFLSAVPVRAAAGVNYINCKKTAKYMYTFDRSGIGNYRPQDFFIDGGQVYRFSASRNLSDKRAYLQVFDFKKGKQTGRYSVTGGHCAVATSVKKGGQTLLYLQDPYGSPTVYENRLDKKKTVFLRKFVFSSKKYGYHIKHAVDPSGRYLYGIGYKSPNRSQGGNRIIVSVWDLKSLKKTGASAYTPKCVSSFTVGHIPFCQGMCVYRNKLYIMSSDAGNPTSRVFVISLSKKRVTDLYCNFPDAVKKNEMQGVSVYNGNLYINSNYGLFFASKIVNP